MLSSTLNSKWSFFPLPLGCFCNHISQGLSFEPICFSFILGGFFTISFLKTILLIPYFPFFFGVFASPFSRAVFWFQFFFLCFKCFLWVSFLNCSRNPKLFILFGWIWVFILQRGFLFVSFSLLLKKTRGVSQGGLAVSIKKYIKAKEEFWKSSKRNQNPSRWS